MTVLAAKQFDIGPAGATVVLAANEQIGSKAGGSLTYSAVLPVTGAFSARAQAGVGEFAYLSEGFTAAAAVWGQVLWTTPAVAPTALVYLFGLNLGTVGAVDVRLNPDMTVTMRDRGPVSGLAVWSSPPLSPSTRVRLVVFCAPGSAAGLRLQLYVGEAALQASTPTYDSGLRASSSALTTVGEFRAGILYGTTGVFSVEFDAVSVETTQPAAVPVNPLPGAGNPPPVVDLGMARTVPPGLASLILTAVASDSGGGIASYIWRVVETGAPEMTAVGPVLTVVPPVLRFDQTWTYAVTALDSAGQGSVEAQAAVTFLAVTEWHCGADLLLVPCRVVTADGVLMFVTAPGPQTAVVGGAVSLQLTATGTFTPPASWTATGLPAGLSVNSSTGLIGGTPTAAGVFTVAVTATKGAASASRTFPWVVNAAPAASQHLLTQDSRTLTAESGSALTAT